jgi:ABC-type multidrug transport system ATPase subunit
MELQIRVKNYRGFEDGTPLLITIGKGFTTLVGPNNAGKSSLLKMFYELRSLWSELSTGNDFLELFKGNHRGLRPQGVNDQCEVFCDFNTRDIEIELTLLPESLGTEHVRVINSIRMTVQRTSLNYTVNYNCSPNFDLAKHQARLVDESTLIDSSGQVKVDGRSMIDHFKKLANGMYIGPFRNAISQASSSYFDISIGTEFVNTWNQWKTGSSKWQNLVIERITEDIRNIFGFTKLEITAAQDLKSLQVNVDGRPFKLGELGAGLSQFIVVFASAAIRKPDYIFIDEPELSLHPSLQIDFLTSLASYATEGVVFATHSIGLARSIGDRIFSLQKNGNSVICKPFEQTPNYAEFLGEMSFSSFKELGFERILLVEGVTDVKTTQQFLRLLNKDHKVVVLPLGGDQLAKGNVELELAELARITLPGNISALVDSERGSAGAAPIIARTLFEESCKKLGFKVRLTQLRAIENYLSDRAIKEELGPSFNALGQYEALKASSNPWDKRETWRIARRMKWQELESTDVGQFLASL